MQQQQQALHLYGKCNKCGFTQDALDHSGACINKRACGTRRMLCYICNASALQAELIRDDATQRMRCADAERDGCNERFAATQRMSACGHCGKYNWQGGNAAAALQSGNAKAVASGDGFMVVCCDPSGGASVNCAYCGKSIDPQAADLISKDDPSYRCAGGGCISAACDLCGAAEWRLGVAERSYTSEDALRAGLVRVMPVWSASNLQCVDKHACAARIAARSGADVAQCGLCGADRQQADLARHGFGHGALRCADLNKCFDVVYSQCAACGVAGYYGYEFDGITDMPRLIYNGKKALPYCQQAACEYKRGKAERRRSVALHKINSSKQVGFARNPSESEFQEWTCSVASGAKWRYYHTVIPRLSRRGYPDLHLVKKPYSVFAELKTQSGVLTAMQAEWQEELLASGAIAVTWRPGMRQSIAEFLANPRQYIERHGGAPHDVYVPDQQSAGCILCGAATNIKQDGTYFATCRKCRELAE